jgi:bacterioferritin-associated ferredoxin
MIVCVCNGIGEKQIKSAARAKAIACPKQVYRSLGCRPQCGQCLSVARDILRQEYTAAA